MRKIVIAIDGFSGCGKSTTAKAVAHLLKYVYIDTGAMYRAVTLYFLEHYVNLTNPKQVQQSLGEIEIEFERESSGEDCEIYLNGSNVSLIMPANSLSATAFRLAGASTGGFSS
jgi:cytidylate kinase